MGRRLWFAGLFVLLTPILLGQSTGVAEEGRSIVRIYDIRDLLVDSAAVLPPNETVSSVPRPPYAVHPAAIGIADSLKAVVEPESWRDNRGSVGSTHAVEGYLVVTQTVENHRRIGAVLAELRKQRQLQLQIDIHLLSVDQQTFLMLSRGPALLSAERAAALINPPEGAPVTLLAAPRALLFSGQFAQLATSVSLSRQPGVVAPVTPPTEISAVPPSGSLLVQAAATDDRSRVTVHLRHGVTTLPNPGPASRPAPRPETLPAAHLDITWYAILGGQRLADSRPESRFLIYLVQARVLDQPEK